MVLAMALAIALAGCTPSGGNDAPAEDPPATEEETPATTEEDPAAETPEVDLSELTIGYNAGSDSLEFFQNVQGGMKYMAEKLGVKFVDIVSDFDPEKIIPNTEQLLMQGSQVIVDFNVNAEIGGNIVEVVKGKDGKGTISIDVEYFTADGTDQAWFMGINNQRAGELCGEAIGDFVTANKDGNLEKLVLFFNSENGDEVKKRMGGAIDGLKTKGIELTEDQIEWIDLGGGGSDTTIQGKDKFAAWLTANPDVKSVAVVAVNDETTQGVFAAAETANRTQDCILASHNVSEQFKELALKGDTSDDNWIGSVAYHPEKYGEYIIPLAIDIFTGANTDPTVKTVMEPEFITQDMIQKYVDEYDAYVAQW
jgi:ribose transport system substrate-binding protein